MKHLKLFLLCGLGLYFAGISSYGQSINTEEYTFEKETEYCTVNMSAELPVATDDDVCTKITSQLYSILESVFSDNDLATLSPYNGNDMNSRAVTEYYFQLFFKELNNSSYETAKEYEDYQAEFSLRISKGYETPFCVVFNHHEFTYAGSAHGFEFKNTYTFSKKDGHIVDEFLDSARDLSSFQSMIRRGLCDRFQTAPENLGDYIDVDEYHIPLPSSALYPSKEGIVFYYAAYEIAPYYAGESYFTVPYDEIIPFLSKEARELLIGGKDATEELSSIALELCEYIPDHGILDDAECHMTPEYFRAVDEAFAAPDGCYDGIGDNEWLWYFVTGNDGSSPYYTVKSVFLVDPAHAFADITIQDIYDWEEGGKPHPESIVHRCIKMTKTEGKWLLDNFENTKQDCQDYVKRLRAKYKSGEILKSLQSDDYTRVFVPEFKKSVEEFYQKYGK